MTQLVSYSPLNHDRSSSVNPEKLHAPPCPEGKPTDLGLSAKLCDLALVQLSCMQSKGNLVCPGTQHDSYPSIPEKRDLLTSLSILNSKAACVCRRHHTCWFQTIFKSHRNLPSQVLRVSRIWFDSREGKIIRAFYPFPSLEYNVYYIYGTENLSR